MAENLCFSLKAANQVTQEMVCTLDHQCVLVLGRAGLVGQQVVPPVVPEAGLDVPGTCAGKRRQGEVVPAALRNHVEHRPRG